MSGAGRRRGRGRAQSGGGTSSSSSQRGRFLAPGQFDGPASRGSGSASRRASTAGSATGTPDPQDAQVQPGSPRASVSDVTSGLAQMGVARDPARDPGRVPRPTDIVRNVDLPASSYNIDSEVCDFSDYLPNSHLASASCLEV